MCKKCDTVRLEKDGESYLKTYTNAHFLIRSHTLLKRRKERYTKIINVKKQRKQQKKERDIVESERGRKWVERTRLKKEVERQRGGRKRKVGERNLKTESVWASKRKVEERNRKILKKEKEYRYENKEGIREKDRRKASKR